MDISNDINHKQLFNLDDEVVLGKGRNGFVSRIKYSIDTGYTYLIQDVLTNEYITDFAVAHYTGAHELLESNNGLFNIEKHWLHDAVQNKLGYVLRKNISFSSSKIAFLIGFEIYSSKDRVYKKKSNNNNNGLIQMKFNQPFMEDKYFVRDYMFIDSSASPRFLINLINHTIKDKINNNDFLRESVKKFKQTRKQIVDDVNELEKFDKLMADKYIIEEYASIYDILLSKRQEINNAINRKIDSVDNLLNYTKEIGELRKVSRKFIKLIIKNCNIEIAFKNLDQIHFFATNAFTYRL